MNLFLFCLLGYCLRYCQEHTRWKSQATSPHLKCLYLGSCLILVTDHLGYLFFFSFHALNSHSYVLETQLKSECAKFPSKNRSPGSWFFSLSTLGLTVHPLTELLCSGTCSNKLIFSSNILNGYCGRASCTLIRTTRVHPVVTLIYKGVISVGSSTGPRWVPSGISSWWYYYP